MMEHFDGIPFHLLLVDAGYDVWVGNNRGTMYSWGHKTLSASEHMFRTLETSTATVLMT